MIAKDRLDANEHSPGPLVTTVEAADILGISTRAVRKAIAKGRLPGRLSGGTWLVNVADLEHYRSTRHPDRRTAEQIEEDFRAAVREAVGENPPPLSGMTIDLIRGVFRSTRADKARGTAASPPMRPQVPVPPLPPMPAMPQSTRPAPESRAPEPILSGVYFIRSGDLVKIGTSIDVHRRLAALRTSSPMPMELLVVASGSYVEEKSVHQRFAHLRQHGEWFTAAPELLGFVAQIAAATCPEPS